MAKREVQSWYRPPLDEVCPLCGRMIPSGQRDEHHLIPKAEGGRETVALHRICHRQLHALFSERELATAYASVDRLLDNEQVKAFVNWVRTKPVGFHERTRSSRRKR
ncbi:HNH endonuclease [Paraburkholderia azotifigens]|uniref:HNH endonuclease n=1 Tax=Paraburkholderia azotifigens TaxID=2057004 RepID=UPI00317F0369